jgi:hypothetical protein
MKSVTAGLFFAVTLAELIDLTGGVDDFLLAGIKRMAVRADFHMQILADSGAGFESVAAAADHVDFSILRMDVRFHVLSLPNACKKVAHDTVINLTQQART